MLARPDPYSLQGDGARLPIHLLFGVPIIIHYHYFCYRLQLILYQHYAVYQTTPTKLLPPNKLSSPPKRYISETSPPLPIGMNYLTSHKIGNGDIFSLAMI